MIKINDDNLLENFGDQVITKINSIIITTNVGNIITISWEMSIRACFAVTVFLIKFQEA